MPTSLGVHVLHDLSGQLAQPLETLVPQQVSITYGTQLPEPASFHVLVAGRPSPEHLDASPNLHTLIIPWAGLPPETRTLAQERSHLAVHNLHHNARNVAEMTMALLLSASKWILPMDRKLRNHDWTPRYEPNPSVMLNGKTVLILGYGAIGRAAAPMCQALGMTVIATKRSLQNPCADDEVEVFPAKALNELLPRAEVLLICLPLTAETQGLIGETELALLPPKATLINVGRGSIVDEAALYEALSQQKLHSAGLDVWYNYPADEASRCHTLPANHPFGELDNVVMSPHRAGSLFTRETETLRAEALAELIRAVANGTPVPNRVDLTRGY